MAIFRRKLQKNERNGAFLLHIPVAVVKGMRWKKGDLLEIDDFEDTIIIVKAEKVKE